MKYQRANRTTSISGLLFIVAILFNSCQEETITEKEGILSVANEIEIGSDGTTVSKSSSTASIGVDIDVVRLAKISVWLYRAGSSPEGNIRLRLVRVGDNAKLLQSAALAVSSLSTNTAGTKVTWSLAEGSGYEVEAGNIYRIEVIPSYDALLEDQPWQNEIIWPHVSADTYAAGTATSRVRNSTDITNSQNHDRKLVTQNFDDDGNLYTDQETTPGITTFVDNIINVTYSFAPDGYINGQEFIPLY